MSTEPHLQKSRPQLSRRRRIERRVRIIAAVVMSGAAIVQIMFAYYAMTGNARHVAQIVGAFGLLYLSELVSKGCFRG